MQNTDNLLTRKEAADFLRCSTNTLAAWSSKKKNIPICKIGALVRYKLSDLQEFVNKSKQQVTCDSANG